MCRCVQEHRTETVSVSHDGDPRAVLNAPYEGVAPSWNDQINILVQLQERRDFRPCLDRLDVPFRNLGL